jgi:hypothetical protein
MKYHRLNLMNQKDPDFCVLHHYPDGMGIKTYKMTRGIEVPPQEYPEDPKIFMTDEEPGMVVPDLVGNVVNLLIISKRLKDALAGVNQGQVQYLPVSIYNHKKRVASSDHCIVNPLGTFDVLDTSASKIDYKDGEVVSVKTFVVDPKKVASAPDLFRIKESPIEIAISDKVLAAWRAIVPKPTNVSFATMEGTS